MKKPQLGFTLIELLIALLLVVVLLVSVQRYMAGVAVDAQDISADKDQATQTRIVLSNMQRDVAQAGYFPYASVSDLTETIGVSTTGSTLTVASYQPEATARDCRNTSEEFSNTQTISGWIWVENFYFVDSKTLSCNANGSINAAPFLDNVVDIQFTQETASLLHVCLITAGNVSTTNCKGTGTVNGYKTEIDMPILSTTFKTRQ